MSKNHPPAFVISDAAANQIATLIAGEPAGTVFRAQVDPGGCAGMQYKFDLTTERLDDDVFITRGKATVVIDALSLELLAGSVLDYKQEMIGSAFVVENPNAKSACGCGSSFSL